MIVVTVEPDTGCVSTVTYRDQRKQTNLMGPGPDRRSAQQQTPACSLIRLQQRKAVSDRRNLSESPAGREGVCNGPGLVTSQRVTAAAPCQEALAPPTKREKCFVDFVAPCSCHYMSS
jgi:hypothetical protein